MKNKLLLLTAVGVLTYGGIASADVCKVKPEAESVKNPLPVKYQKLKKENAELKAKLQECCSSKAQIKEEIENLNAQISQLETEKVQLQNKLNLLPSKESLEAQIQELENRVGR